jgi:hypothetical protein
MEAQRKAAEKAASRTGVLKALTGAIPLIRKEAPAKADEPMPDAGTPAAPGASSEQESSAWRTAWGIGSGESVTDAASQDPPQPPADLTDPAANQTPSEGQQ